MSEPTLAVRRAARSDEDLVYRLLCDMESAAFKREAFSQRFSALLADGHRPCYIVEVDGVAAGYLSLRIECPLHHERPVAEIVELVVAPEVRNRGVGSALFAHVCQCARQSGCELIEVHSKLARVAAHRFYERMGMVKTHVHLTKSLLAGEGQAGES